MVVEFIILAGDLGSVHGGAIALAIEKACLLTIAGGAGKESDRVLSGLEVNYFSVAKVI